MGTLDFTSNSGTLDFTRPPSSGGASDASALPYTPANPAGWSPVPATVADALDELDGAVGGVGGGTTAASSVTATRINGDSVPLVKGMPVVVTDSNTIKRANASSLGLSSVLGLVTLGASMTLPTTVLTEGVLALSTGEWDDITGDVGGLVPGAAYYLSPFTAGALTTTPPSTPGQSVTFVGLALSTTEMRVHPEPSVLL